MFSKGDLVRHATMPSWGIGRVVHTAQGGNLLIRFELAGEKLIHPGYATLTRVPDDDLLFLVIKETQIKKGRSVRTTRIIPVVKLERS